MKHYIKTLVLFSLPFILLLAIYIYTDPFKVVWNYDNYYPTGKSDGISLNPSHVGTRNYLLRQPHEHYNAFIFGNSRSIYYPIAEWQKHLPTGSRCYHFDAAAESVQGIWEKVRLIESQGDSLRNVLLVCDADLLSRLQNPHWHLCESDPALTGYCNWASFHWYNLRAFLNVKYMCALLDYRLFHTLRPYMLENHMLSEDLFLYDSVSNECNFQPMEQQIASGTYYTPQRINQFQGVQFPDSVSAPVLGPRHLILLDSIANVFHRHHTQCHIIVSPLYNQIRLNPADIKALQERFGKGNVHNFSGPNQWNADYHNYFETSHYRTRVAEEILRQIE
ncbi:MAG: hypothetical protein J6W52_10770 [Bacteroidaceae bacterium]|nr:hypothetical protein [Bacteroidaceae bacterium]